MLRQRVLSSIVFVPILIAAIWFGNPWFSIVVAVVALLGALEFYNIVSQRGWRPLTIFGTLWTLFFIFNAYYDPSYTSESTKLLVTFSLVASAVAIPLIIVLFLRPAGKRTMISWASSLTGVFYIGWLLSYWVLIMNSYGRDWVFIALFSTFAVDTTAYFVGRALGRHKMAPKVSPSKTWEGAAGGLVGSLVAVVVLAVLFDVDISYGQMILLGFLIAVFAQLGDLAESKLKRSVGVKEAGNLIPGHGGILDRLDSIVFTGVVVYYCLRWFIE
ncbi:MAG TPA: phosphatidate cytidylyltransferase [Dehalococcoidia bacterium]|nr:phosphatidate cytidylyltransferase [Dehalococcoidia bacterium]